MPIIYQPEKKINLQNEEINTATWISDHSDQQIPLKMWLFRQLEINKQVHNCLCKI